MAGGTARAFGEPLELLFGAGTCAGLSDGQLLSRLVAGRDQAGELAFEALVMRHGPMVLRVCNQALDDPDDVHDALQAVFLVLAHRAAAIHSRESVGSWLYGVALRVASRARVTAIRRHIRDRRTTLAAQAIAATSPRQAERSSIEREDRARILDQEISRLPEKYRAPIVLCYLEGLTHDEAATRLSWPVGTVRSRLSRGRDALRHRLNRRGVTATALLGPLGAWVSGEQLASAAQAGAVAAAELGAIPTKLSTAIVKMVFQVAAGPSPAASSVQAGSLALAQGVLNMMALKKLMVTASVLVSLFAITIGGGVVWVRTSQAQGSQKDATQPTSSQASKAATSAVAVEPADVDRLVQEMRELARRRYETARDFFGFGKVSLDRVIDACEQIREVELSTAKSQEERRTILERSLSRLKELETLVVTEFDRGRGTQVDVDSIKWARMQAELDLKTLPNNTPDTASILRRLSDLERKVDQLQTERKATPANPQ